MSIDLALEIAQHNAVTARLPEAGEFGRIADLIRNPWQPISTAPRDRPFLAVLDCAGERIICTMRWSVAERKNSEPTNPCFQRDRVTHWMELPEVQS